MVASLFNRTAKRIRFSHVVAHFVVPLAIEFQHEIEVGP